MTSWKVGPGMCLAHKVACEKRASIAVDVPRGFPGMASVTKLPAGTKRAATPALGMHTRLDLDETLAALIGDGVISEADAKRVRADVRTTRGRTELHPLVLVANLKLADGRHPEKPLSLEVLVQWLAERAGLPYLKIDPMKIDVAAVTQVISHAYAQRYRILPVAVTEMHVVLATPEPFDTRWVADLGHILRRDIQRVVASPLDVGRYLAEWWSVQRSIQRAQDAKNDIHDGRAILNFEQLVELGKTGDVGVDDRHVVHIVDWLLQYAFEQRASDIHLEPRRDTSNIRFRIDGVMHKVFELPTPVMTAVTSRIKILGRMDVAEKRRPQDGRIKTRSVGGREVELRLSSMPTAFGEKMVMRIFDPDIVVQASFASLASRRTRRRPGADSSTARMASCSSPVRPGRARRRRCTRRSRCWRPRTSMSARSKTRSRWCPRNSIRCRCIRRSTSTSPPACARCCARIRTSSWSARFAIWKPRKWRYRRR